MGWHPMHTRHDQAHEVHQAVVEAVGSPVQYSLLQALQVQRSPGIVVAWILGAVGIG